MREKIAESQISRLKFKLIVHDRQIGKYRSLVIDPNSVVTERGIIHMVVCMADGTKIFSENPLHFTQTLDTLASQYGGRFYGRKAINPWKNRLWNKSHDDKGAEVYLRTYIF